MARRQSRRRPGDRAAEALERAAAAERAGDGQAALAILLSAVRARPDAVRLYGPLARRLTSMRFEEAGPAVAEAVTSGKTDGGVVVCGTGIGISIAANRHPGIRAALCHDVTMARLCREHNDANVLSLGGRMIGEQLARAIAIVFLRTDFEGGRHQKRIDKISRLES